MSASPESPLYERSLHAEGSGSQATLSFTERDAALELLQAARRVAHTLALGFWPKDKRLAELEAAIQDAAKTIGVKR